MLCSSYAVQHLKMSLPENSNILVLEYYLWQTGNIKIYCIYCIYFYILTVCKYSNQT